MESSPSITKSFLETSFGKICLRSVGSNRDPLFLIIHGSGTNSSSADYEFLLFEYLARYYISWKVFLVSIDCPGYGESKGLRSVIRAFPSKFIQEVAFRLTGQDSCFILMGHSQGGYSI